MATSRVPSERAAFEADVIHEQLGALTDASRQRHRLVPGTPEYDAALEIEERIAEHVWQLATELGPQMAVLRAESPTSRAEGCHPTGSRSRSRADGRDAGEGIVTKSRPTATSLQGAAPR